MANTKITAANIDSTSTGFTLADLTVDTTTLVVDSTNNRVGIGTASPSYPLHVQIPSDGSIGASFRYIGGTNNPGLFFSTNESTRVSSIDASGSTTGILAFKTSGTEYMRIDSSGNVGISVTSPSEKLEVDGGLKISNSNSRLYFGTEGGTSYRALEGSTSGSLLQVGEGYTNIALQGDVGVGTTSPSYPFHVTGSGDTVAAVTAGASSVAALNLGNDTNKADGGIRYDNSADSLIFRASNAEKMRIDSSGNVGIGATNPSEMLHMNNTAGTGCFIRFQNTGGSGVYIGGRSEVMEMYTNGSEKMRITSDGKVGIGTNSPDSLLHISSGTAGDAILILESDTDNNDEADNPQIWFKGDGDITKGAVRVSDNELEIISNVDSASGIKFYVGGTNNTGTTDPGTSATERMRIDSSGNVGINCTDQSNLLTVDANSASSGTDSISVRNRGVSSANHTTGLRFQFNSAVPSAIRSSLTNTSNGEGTLNFYTSSDGSAANLTERMRIDSSGRITTPNQPAFHAYGPSAAVSTSSYVVYQYTYVNTGSHYSTSNGRFTAPVAGVYLFFWSAIGNNTNTVYRWHIHKNGSATGIGANDVHLRQDTGATGSEYATNASRVQMVSLSANDYVQIYFASDNGTSAYYQSDYVNFGGYLIG